MRAEDVIIAGELRTIAYARDAGGHAHAREFLDEVCPPEDRTKLHRWFIRIANYGEQASTQAAFKHEVGPIHAFKASEARIAAFRVGRTWFLTNGFIKKRDRWRQTELQRALRIRAEHLAQEGIE